MSGAGEVTESPSSVATLESADKDADKPKLDASASDKWTEQASYGNCHDTVWGHRLPGRHSSPARQVLEKLGNLSSRDDEWDERVENAAFETDGLHTFLLDDQRGTYTVLQALAVGNAELKALLSDSVHSVTRPGPIVNTSLNQGAKRAGDWFVLLSRP